MLAGATSQSHGMGGSDDVTASRWCLGPHWRMDPKLELWVDVEQSPVVLRLTGTLDASTATSVLSVAQELVDEGYRQVVLVTADLFVADGEGARTLLRIEDLLDRRGGHVARAVCPPGLIQP